jgi:hypothetical protein
MPYAVLFHDVLKIKPFHVSLSCSNLMPDHQISPGLLSHCCQPEMPNDGVYGGFHCYGSPVALGFP